MKAAKPVFGVRYMQEQKMVEKREKEKESASGESRFSSSGTCSGFSTEMPGESTGSSTSEKPEMGAKGGESEHVCPGKGCTDPSHRKESINAGGSSGSSASEKM